VIGGQEQEPTKALQSVRNTSPNDQHTASTIEHDAATNSTSQIKKVDLIAPHSDPRTNKADVLQSGPIQRNEQQGHSFEIRQKNIEIARIREQWQQEVEELRECEAQLKKTELELRAENRHLVLARQERERAGKDPLEYELFQKNQEIWVLSRRLQDQQKLACFAQRGLEQPNFINRKLIDETFDTICSEIESMMLGHDMSKSTAIPAIIPGTDFAALVASFCDGDTAASHAEKWLRRCILKFGLELVVKILLVAALRSWIFDTNFPNFTPGDLRLLRAYRIVIINHGQHFPHL